MHDLPPIRFGDDIVALRLVVRRAEDGTWRGRLVFGSAEAEEPVSTAEIFCGATEPDLWDSVRDLRDHHMRDLYRSLLAEWAIETSTPEERLRKLRHDLANPLSAILAETQLMLLDESSLDRDTVRSLREIESLSRRMRDILQQVP